MTPCHQWRIHILSSFSKDPSPRNPKPSGGGADCTSNDIRPPLLYRHRKAPAQKAEKPPKSGTPLRLEGPFRGVCCWCLYHNMAPGVCWGMNGVESVSACKLQHIFEVLLPSQCITTGSLVANSVCPQIRSPSPKPGRTLMSLRPHDSESSKPSPEHPADEPLLFKNDLKRQARTPAHLSRSRHVRCEPYQGVSRLGHTAANTEDYVSAMTSGPRDSGVELFCNSSPVCALSI